MRIWFVTASGPPVILCLAAPRANGNHVNRPRRRISSRKKSNEDVIRSCLVGNDLIECGIALPD